MIDDQTLSLAKALRRKAMKNHKGHKEHEEYVLIWNRCFVCFVLFVVNIMLCLGAFARDSPVLLKDVGCT
jgi:hypothetical protein